MPRRTEGAPARAQRHRHHPAGRDADCGQRGAARPAATVRGDRAARPCRVTTRRVAAGAAPARGAARPAPSRRGQDALAALARFAATLRRGAARGPDAIGTGRRIAPALSARR
ncbi:hypothetical protein [Roseicella aerolata]|uniref:Uncharacterized protein n=1 Tax=Roseicella aerolata TaxID=2883479 RepID=A0A9X1IFC5_9PROT|nr:hypothetical protein [Roseicella aerolata]MCB4823776.1 hypothetical protein [Roseicella aerolata]